MRCRPSGAPVLMAALLALFTCTTARAAAPEDSLASVADYLAAFADAYQPGSYDAATLLGAQAAAQRAGLTMAPDVTFEQSLDWTAYSTLNLDLETRLRLPLYDSQAGPSLMLASADLEAVQAAVAAARDAAELAFFVDLATFATLAQASSGLAQVLNRLDAAPWLTDPTFEPLDLAPADRALFEAHLRLLDMNTFLSTQLIEVVRRIARLLAIEEQRLAAPSTAAVRAAVPAQPDADTCLAAAPALEAARLRHRQTTLATALDATLPVTVGLTSDLAVTLVGAGPTGGSTFQLTPTATLALEARLGLPTGRSAWQDIDSTLSATASPSGASQSLRMSWPRPPHPVAFDSDPDAVLANESNDVAVTLRALRRAVAQAATEKARLQRAVDWLLLDSFGPSPTRTRADTSTPEGSTAGTVSAVLPPDTPPGLAAQIADLNTQLAFAELDEVIASAQLASACGAWP